MNDASGPKNTPIRASVPTMATANRTRLPESSSGITANDQGRANANPNKMMRRRASKSDRLADTAGAPSSTYRRAPRRRARGYGMPKLAQGVVHQIGGDHETQGEVTDHAARRQNDLPSLDP